MKNKKSTIAFQPGDATARELTVALHHEILRCEDAFKEFTNYGTALIFDPKNRWIAFKAYNSYAQFVQSLFESILGIIARDKNVTEDHYSDGEAKKRAVSGYLLNELTRITVDSAPPTKQAVDDFYEAFRNCRNKTSGHVAYERASSKMSLTDFYQRYHKYAYDLFANQRQHWGLRSGKEFPDLKEITDFSLNLLSTCNVPAKTIP